MQILSADEISKAFWVIHSVSFYIIIIHCVWNSYESMSVFVFFFRFMIMKFFEKFGSFLHVQLK